MRFLRTTGRGFLGYAYASMGRRRDAEQILVEEDPSTLRHPALTYAEKMAAMKDRIVDIYAVFPEFALMRNDPRMKEFRRKRNLPWPP